MMLGSLRLSLAAVALGLTGLAACGDDAKEAPAAPGGGAADAAGSPATSSSSGAADAGPAPADGSRPPEETGIPIYLAGLDPSGFARSTDGRTWSDVQAVERGDAGAVEGDNAVTDIAFGNGVAIAVGDAGISLTRDGSSWTLVWPGRLHSAVATFGAGHFVVLAGGLVLTSADGIAWTSIADTGDATHWHSLVFGRVQGVEQFVAVGDQWEFVDGKDPVAPHRLKRSFDGVQWEYVAVHRDTPEGAEQIDQLVLGNDIVLGMATRDRPGVAYRFDGVSLAHWEKIEAGDAVAPLAFGYDGTSFLIVDTERAARTKNGHDWTVANVVAGDAGVDVSFVPMPFYGGMRWASDHWIAPHPFHVDAARIAESYDGVTWNAFWTPTEAESQLGSVSVVRYGRVAGP